MMRLRQTLPIAVTTLFTLTACGDDGPPPAPVSAQYNIEVEVFDVDQNPVPKVPVELDGKVVGYTDQLGEFKGTLTEVKGKNVTLAVRDIEGYRLAPETKRELTDELKVTQVGGTLSGVPIYMRVEVESVRKSYMVWVRAKCDETIDSCGDLPVLLNGREMARTNHLGYAHFSFSDVPQNDIELKIDTPKHDPSDKESPMFEPRDPTYSLTLDLEPQIYRIEETFSDPNAPKKKPKKKRNNRRRSNKKKSNKKTQKKVEEKPPEPIGIDLFGD